MGATSAEVKVANLQGQIDGMDRGYARAMQSNFFNQSSNFMSNLCGSFMGCCAANMTNMFRFDGGFGWGFGGGYGGFSPFGRFGW